MSLENVIRTARNSLVVGTAVASAHLAGCVGLTTTGLPAADGDRRPNEVCEANVQVPVGQRARDGSGEFEVGVYPVELTSGYAGQHRIFDVRSMDSTDNRDPPFDVYITGTVDDEGFRRGTVSLVDNGKPFRNGERYTIQLRGTGASLLDGFSYHPEVLEITYTTNCADDQQNGDGPNGNFNVNSSNMNVNGNYNSNANDNMNHNTNGNMNMNANSNMNGSGNGNYNTNGNDNSNHNGGLPPIIESDWNQVRMQLYDGDQLINPENNSNYFHPMQVASAKPVTARLSGPSRLFDALDARGYQPTFSAQDLGYNENSPNWELVFFPNQFYVANIPTAPTFSSESNGMRTLGYTFHVVQDGSPLQRVELIEAKATYQPLGRVYTDAEQFNAY